MYVIGIKSMPYLQVSLPDVVIKTRYLAISGGGAQLVEAQR
jgi:hypothetical protein